MNKIDLILKFLGEKSLPELHKEREYTIQEYMKLKQDSLYKLAATFEKTK